MFGVTRLKSKAKPAPIAVMPAAEPAAIGK
jgi:hypothetical protein